jgi:L-threonylcarbamoyladenylate synthase
MNPFHQSLALKALYQNGVIACSTEAVWGLSGLWDSDTAIKKILTLKQRDWRKGLIVVVDTIESIVPWLQPLSADNLQILYKKSAQPTTWLLPCKQEISPLVRGLHDHLAVRITTHPPLKTLCKQAGPLLSTSANITGHPVAKTALQVRQIFGNQIDYLLPGSLGGHSQASTIKYLNGRQIR